MFTTQTGCSSNMIPSFKHSTNNYKTDSNKIYCAIFSAMPEELDYFQKAFANATVETINVQGLEFNIYEYCGKKILISHTGLGTTFAASIATLVHHHFSPEYILLSGTAGGIKSELRLRDVIIADKAFEAEIQGAFKLLKDTPFESCLTHPLKNECFPQKHDGSDVKGSAEAAAKVLLKILDALILKHNSQTLHELEMNPEAVNEAQTLIKKLNLQPHPEGGYFARAFQSTNTVKSTDKNLYDDELRSAGSSIYYLLQGNDFSAWHILKSDELWHYYTGSTVKIYVIDKQGNLTTHLLGNSLLNPNSSFQIAIPAGNWFAAEIVDKTSYSLVGCTVNPGFEFKDFKLADRATLSAEFPHHSNTISQFSRIHDHNL